MYYIILISGLINAIITWLFILLRKSFLKKHVIAFDVNIIILMFHYLGVMYFNIKNSPNEYEFWVKFIVNFLFFLVYIYVSMMLFRKATLLEDTRNQLRGERQK